MNIHEAHDRGSEAFNFQFTHEDHSDVFVDGFVAGRTLNMDTVAAISAGIHGEAAKEEFLPDVAKALIDAGLMIKKTSAEDMRRLLTQNPDIDGEGRNEIMFELHSLGVISG